MSPEWKKLPGKQIPEVEMFEIEETADLKDL